MHQKQLVKALNQHEREQGRAVGGGLEQLEPLKQRDAGIYYIVDK